MIEIVTGDLFDSKEKFLCHQTNCISNKSAHLAKDVFTKYPWADVYSNRIEPNKPGTIEVRGNGQNQRYVINMFGQYYPGKSKYPYSTLDGQHIREKYFYHCLLRIAKIPNLESVVFPWRIGCGSAGGIWEHYLGKITNFATYIENTQGAKVIIYRREGDE
jgi:hypothetical protein